MVHHRPLRVYNGRHFKAVGDRSQAWPVLKNSSKNRQKSEKSRVFLGADFSAGKKRDSFKKIASRAKKALSSPTRDLEKGEVGFFCSFGK